MNPAAASPLPEILPPLRQDLRLHAAAPNADGSPAWVIQDPVANSFYRIGWIEFSLLSNWHLGSPEDVLSQVRKDSPLVPSADELAALVKFLNDHQLLAIHHPRQTERLIALAGKARMSRARWLLHHYLFFRIPLWHPEQVLQAMLPYLRWMLTPSFVVGAALAGLTGLILTVRQWDTFAASLSENTDPTALVGYGLALILTKSVHELAHALAATRYGVRVAHMGVAFLVMWPVLYTDTGESWRLPNRHQRLAIASAGIAAELVLAALATLAWNFTEQPELRQVFFFVATTAWMMSLALNASPFMRFDGYFILSDLLDLPNLHERAFALARVRLRNLLLGWSDPDPEPFPPARRRFLIAFALITWCYRLVVFLGIAVAVYVYFFKLLGIFLFAVEIAWFVLRPIWNELLVWRQRSHETSGTRKRMAAAVVVLLLALGLVPWSTSVRAPAWAHAEVAQTIYSPLPARVLQAPAGSGPIAAGATLYVFEQPESLVRDEVANLASAALRNQLAGLQALPDGEEKRIGLTHLLDVHQAEASAERAEQARLVLRSPYPGVLTDIDEQIVAGSWVNPRQPLATVVQPGRWQVEAFVGQRDLDRVRTGDTMRFFRHDDRIAPLHGRIIAVERFRLAGLPHPALSTQHGGDIAIAAADSGGRMSPRDALYRVIAQLDEPPDRLAQLTGTAVIEGRLRSWLWEAMKAVLVVLVREASF